MTDFSDVLLAVDFDRTTTDSSSRIPQNNLDAVREFMAQGGSFTVATGRSVPMFQPYLDAVPVNAPMILYNGAAFFDNSTKTLLDPVEIPDGARILRELLDTYPQLWTEIQGVDYHYLFGDCPMRDEYYRYNRAPSTHIDGEPLPRPLMKFAMYGDFVAPTVASMFEDLPQELPMIDRITAELREKYGDVIVVDRAAPRIIDIQEKSVNKGTAARRLADKLGKKILVCAGDAPNDVSMLRAADLAYVPADCDPTVRALGFEAVCPCGEGAISDLISRLPQALKELGR